MFEVIGFIFCVGLLGLLTFSLTFAVFWSNALGGTKKADAILYVVLYSVLGCGWYGVLSKIHIGFTVVS